MCSELVLTQHEDAGLAVTEYRNEGGWPILRRHQATHRVSVINVCLSRVNTRFRKTRLGSSAWPRRLIAAFVLIETDAWSQVCKSY